jgi:hypothetical protein
MDDVRGKQNDIEFYVKMLQTKNNTIDDQKKMNESLKSQLTSSEKLLVVLREKLEVVEITLNVANEDKGKVSQLFEEKENLIKDQISQISQFEKEIKALNDQLKQFQISKEQMIATISNLEQQNFSLRNENDSTQDLKQQILTYQKQLEDQIRQSEDNKKSLENQIEILEISNSDKLNKMKYLDAKHRSEVSQVKSDGELKTCLEQEKEANVKKDSIHSIVETASEKNNNLTYSYHIPEIISDFRKKNEELSLKSLSLEKSNHESERNSLCANVQDLNVELAKIKTGKKFLESNHLKNDKVVKKTDDFSLEKLFTLSGVEKEDRAPPETYASSIKLDVNYCELKAKPSANEIYTSTLAKLEKGTWNGPGSAIMKEDALEFCKHKVKSLEKEIDKRNKEIAHQKANRYFYYKSGGKWKTMFKKLEYNITNRGCVECQKLISQQTEVPNSK